LRRWQDLCGAAKGRMSCMRVRIWRKRAFGARGVCRDAWGLGDAVLCRALPGKVRRMAGLSPFVRLDRRTIA
jgi:hypothetical protein